MSEWPQTLVLERCEKIASDWHPPEIEDNTYECWGCERKEVSVIPAGLGRELYGALKPLADIGDMMREFGLAPELPEELPEGSIQAVLAHYEREVGK